MLSTLCEIEKVCGDDALKAVIEQRNQADTARKVADAAATSAFGDLEIEGVGTPVWKGLWESARSYSQRIGNNGIDFPPTEGDICVLCHQPIDTETAARMGRFETFIKADTEAGAERAKAALDAAIKVLAQFRIDIRLVSAARKSLSARDNDAAGQILKFMACARLRRWQALKGLVDGEQQELVPPINLPSAQIERAAAEIRAYASSLAATADPAARNHLETELAELQDGKQADNLISIGNAEIERLKKIAIVDACLGDMATNAITRLGNQIADDLITPTMRDQFRQEIVELAANRVHVEVVRSGGKFGSPQYEIRFLSKPEAKVGDVLSEGEQTCVALASYLTELANASHTSALVFDDPVTSLDHRWRNKVARRLISEAGKRQIIVFTHDLIFVNDLHEMGSDSGIPIRLSHLTRGTEGVGVVNDNLPWRASGVRDRVDKLEKAARTAKKLHEVSDEEAYRHEALNIYDELRAAWERGVEDVVFAGVILRHRDYIKTTHLKKVVVLEEADVDAFQAGFEKCCDYIKAHDPSRARDAEPPEPDELLADIDALKTWAETLHTKQKAIS
ncbi:MAG: AAA family ATPase [Rhodospirillaceae bacterium]|nr:AAA family ATPase [Rhodospirillaceae bacterium]